MNYSITHLCISEASRGIIIEATVSVPTHRQYTNEVCDFENTGFKEHKATKSTLLALLRFWSGLRKRIKTLQSVTGDFDLSTTNFSKGITIN